MDRDPPVAPVARLQRLGVGGMELAGDQAILFAQEPADDLRGAWIGVQPARVHLLDHPGVGRRRPEASARQLRHAVLVFAGLLRGLRLQVIEADPRVRIQHRERPRLLQQPLEDEDKRGVLEDVRVVARMEGVPIVHGPV